MKIQDLLRKDVMLLDLQATEKTAAIEEMIHSLVEHGYVTDFETFKEGILAREALTSTGLGDGIAMPHSKNAAVAKSSENVVAVPQATPHLKASTASFDFTNSPVNPATIESPAPTEFFTVPLIGLAKYAPSDVTRRAPSPAIEIITF